MTKEANENAARTLLSALTALESHLEHLQQRVREVELSDSHALKVQLENLERRVKTLEGEIPPPPPQPERPIGGYSFLLLLESSSNLVRKTRYVHLSYGGRNLNAFRIRDYIDKTIWYHPGGTATADNGFHYAKECPLDLDTVWKLGTDWIRAVGELFHPVTDFPWWSEKLQQMTDSIEST